MRSGPTNGVMVLRHVRFEAIGMLEHYLTAAGLAIESVDAFEERWANLERAAFDPARLAGLVVMGGPMNVDEVECYPFLATEVRWLRRAAEVGLPTLGVCLGAQLLAKSLGSRVFPHRVKEIGWYDFERSPAAADDPLFGGSRATETVFQWHGDTFDLPPGAVQLGRTSTCEQQAFRYGPAAYGFQFHVEMTAKMVGDWLRVPDMCAELAAADYIDPEEIARNAPEKLQAMAPFTERLLGGFANLCRRRALGE